MTTANCPIIEEKTAAAKETRVAGAVFQELGGVIVLKEKQKCQSRLSEKKKKVFSSTPDWLLARV